MDQTQIDLLIADLHSTEGIRRQRARVALVEIGEPAVPALIQALDARDGHTHWEAAKALSQICSPHAARRFVELMTADKEFSVRWMAAEGLITMAAPGVEPLLDGLVEHPGSVWLLEGAHHVLHDWISRRLLDPGALQALTPVYEALQGSAAEAVVPGAAARARKALYGRS